VSIKVAGMAATPPGSPFSATAIGPANPCSPAAETVNDCALPPACRLTVAGATVRLKSGGGAVIVSITGALCVIEAEVP